MEEREIHIRDYLRILDKRRYTVLTFFVIVFTVVLIGTLSSTPTYMATTKVLIEKDESPGAMLMNYYYMPYDPEFYETQYQLIKSISVARRVVRMLSLDKTYESYFKDGKKRSSLVSGTFNWFKELVSVVLNVAGIVKPLPSNDNKDDEGAGKMSKAGMIARIISNGITVKPVKNSKIVNISYMSTNPELTKLITNTLAKAYIEELLEMKMSSSRYTIQWMTKKADEERAKLDRSERALQVYMRANDIVTLENRVAIVPQKLSEVGSQLVKVEAKRKVLEALYNKVKSISGDLDKAETIPAIASDPTLQSLREQILKAEQNIMDLSKKYGRKHPTMIRAVGDLNVLKKKREHEIKRVIESIKNEYELMRSNEANLRKLHTKTKEEALNLNEKFIQYGVLKREVETNRQLYDALIKKIKEQSITEQIQSVTVWIVEKAETPKSPVKPKKSLNILLGIIVGLFGGVGLAFFFEYLDNTIKSPNEAEARLGVPVLGVIPFLKSKEENIEGIVLKETTSAFAENYKAVRTAVLLSSADAPPKSILITSIGPEDGKTVTSSNLAIAIAQSEYNVLLIDADLRKPRLHKVFGLNNSKGLSTYLAGASDVNIMHKGPLRNLTIIPSGPVPPNPSELLSSNRMNELIRTLNEKYDIIICDSPPLVTVADGLILSKLLDGTIIVARAGKTTYEIASKSLKSLKDINSHVLGIVINALNIKKGHDYYYKYYNYYYASEEESEY